MKRSACNPLNFRKIRCFPSMEVASWPGDSPTIIPVPFNDVGLGGLLRIIRDEKNTLSSDVVELGEKEIPSLGKFMSYAVSVCFQGHSSWRNYGIRYEFVLPFGDSSMPLIFKEVARDDYRDWQKVTNYTYELSDSDLRLTQAESNYQKNDYCHSDGYHIINNSQSTTTFDYDQFGLSARCQGKSKHEYWYYHYGGKRCDREDKSWDGEITWASFKVPLIKKVRVIETRKNWGTVSRFDSSGEFRPDHFKYKEKWRETFIFKQGNLVGHKEPKQSYWKKEYSLEDHLK